MSREFPKLSTCCFCINLRTGTLVLAFLGFCSSLFGTMITTKQPKTTIVTIEFLYYSLCTLMCCAGLYGLSKNNIKLIRAFAIYYWINLVLNIVVVVISSIVAFKSINSICEEPENLPDMGVGTCRRHFFTIALVSVIVSSVSVVINAYGAFAIWSDYRQTAVQGSYYSLNQDSYRDPEDN